jgi:hypothetical protein
VKNKLIELGDGRDGGRGEEREGQRDVFVGLFLRN